MYGVFLFGSPYGTGAMAYDLLISEAVTLTELRASSVTKSLADTTFADDSLDSQKSGLGLRDTVVLNDWLTIERASKDSGWEG